LAVICVLVESREGSETTLYAYLGTETVYANSSSTTTDYLFAEVKPVSKVSGSTVNYYRGDAFGSTRHVT